MSRVEEQAVDFFYRWDALERRGELEIIDFDLLRETDRHEGAFADRRAAASHVATLLEQADMATLTGQKLRAAHTLLRALCGDEIPFGEYVEGTLGVSPTMIAQEVITRQFELVAKLLEEAGYPHTGDGVARLHADSAVSGDDIREEFEAAATVIVPQVRAVIGLDQNVDYEVQLVDEDAYWSNWTRTDPATGGLLLQINTCQRVSWWRGKAEMLALHEIGGHACQALTWTRQIAEGRLARTAGVSTIFGPEAFCLEGVAQSLSWFLPQDPLSASARRALEMSHLGVLVWNNVHLMLNQRTSVEDALRYAHRWAPGYKNDQAATKQAREAVHDPVLRTYLYAYGASAYQYRLLAEGLGEQGRIALLREAYSRPLLSGDVLERVRSVTTRER
jgi:hypothetical protein